MGFRPRSFPVGGMYVKGVGRLTKVKKKSLTSLFHCFLNGKSTLQILRVYLTGNENESEKHSTSYSRIGLQPFLRTRWYPALVPCSATAVEADFGVRPKVRQYTRQVLKRTESLIVPKTSHTQALGSADTAEKKIIGLKVWKSNARRRESFLATMRKIPWQSRKELHLQLAASCGVYRHGFQCTSNQ